MLTENCSKTNRVRKNVIMPIMLEGNCSKTNYVRTKLFEILKQTVKTQPITFGNLIYNLSYQNKII